jgi:hypothetical protein
VVLPQGTSALQEPRRKMSARQRSRRGGSAAGSDDEAYYAAYGDEYGDYYGGYDAEPEEAYPLPEGKWGLECCVCGGSGPEVACCEVGLAPSRPGLLLASPGAWLQRADAPGLRRHSLCLFHT